MSRRRTDAFVFFFLCGAIPVAMEGSFLARGLIGAELPAYATATAVQDP